MSFFFFYFDKKQSLLCRWLLLKNDIYTYKVARNVHHSSVEKTVIHHHSPPVSRSLTRRLTTLKLPIVSSNSCLVDRTISRSSLSTAVSCSLVVPARNNDLALAERRKCTALAHTTQAHLFWSPFFFGTKHYSYANCLPSTHWTITCWDNAPVKSCSVLFTSRPYPITLSQVVRSRGCINDEHTVWHVSILDNP